MQTCAALGIVRTISYYINFWTLMTVAWVAMFVLSPFSNRLGTVYSALNKGTASVRKVSRHPISSRATVLEYHSRELVEHG